MTYHRPADCPPPCDHVCWERVPHGWRYIASSTACGHRLNTRTGTWEWHGHPAAPTRQGGLL